MTAPSCSSANTLRRLWERMVALYGHAWVSVHGLTPQATDHDALSMSGSTWAGVLAGLTGLQIAEGVNACVAEGGEFPPSAPRFRAMCLGVPSLGAVRSELRHGSPSPYTRAVWTELDVHRYKLAGADQADRLLREAYELVRDRVMRGEPLPASPVAEISHQDRESKPATREQAHAHCEAIRQILRGGTA